MTPPREIHPGQVVFITFRAVARTFRFVPTATVCEILEFCFWEAVAEFGMLVHEYEFLSNHGHLSLTDVRGVLPDFMRSMNAAIARNLNAHRGTSGTCIEKGYNMVIDKDDAAVLKHCVYTLSNAPKAGLVERAREWGGPNSYGMEYGVPKVIKRPNAGTWKYKGDDAQPAPDGKRRKPTKAPGEVTAVLTRPPILPGLSDVELRELIRARVHEKEEQYIRARALKKMSVLGMKRILQQNWWECPTSFEKLFGRIPSVAATTRQAKAAAIASCKAFREAYAAARDAFLAGAWDTEFPRGTWLMRVRYGVRCAQAG